MIFENVKHITNKDSFLELTNVYVRLVEVTAERNKFIVQDSDNVSRIVLEEVCDMGLISSEDDIPLLRRILNKSFIHFISCVSFYLNTSLYLTTPFNFLITKNVTLYGNQHRYLKSLHLWIFSLEPEA